MLPDLFARLSPLFGKLIDLLWIEYQTADVVRKKEIEELLTLLTVKFIGVTVGEERVLLKPPPAEVIGQGEYFLGRVIYPGLRAHPFRIQHAELLRHVFLLGPTGTGKSTMLLNLLLQFLREGKPFMVFDFKRSYRCLLRSRKAKELAVFTIGQETAPLGLNALQPPPGASVEEWVEALTDVIGIVFILLQGARNVLKEALLRAVHEKKEEATLRDALKILESQLRSHRGKSRKYGWLESSARSLEELCKGSYGRVLNAPRGNPISALLDRPVVFELEGLGMDQKRFFCLFFLQSILLLRKKQSLDREVFRHALVFDESHHVFPRPKPGVVDIPSILAREIREYGEAIIAATQQADVSPSLIANSGFKIVMRCDYPDDAFFAAKLMNLEAKVFPKLPMGFSIVRMPVRFYTPFLLKSPKQPLKNKWVEDGQVQARWEELDDSLKPGAVSDSGPAFLSESETLLFSDVICYPLSPVTERYSRLRWNAKTGNSIQRKLVKDGLVKLVPVAVPGGRVKILTLTVKGEERARSYGFEIPSGRYGGVEHEYWKQELARRFREEGYAVELEYGIGSGKVVDLRAVLGGREVVVEVETGKSDVLANVRKCAGREWEVVFFFTSDSLIEKYEKMFRGMGLQGVRVLSPSQVDAYFGEIL